MRIKIYQRVIWVKKEDLHDTLSLVRHCYLYIMHPCLGLEIGMEARRRGKKRGRRKRSRESDSKLALIVAANIGNFFQRNVLETVDRAKARNESFEQGSAVPTDLWYSFRIQDLEEEGKKGKEEGRIVYPYNPAVDRIQPAHDYITKIYCAEQPSGCPRIIASKVGFL